MFENSLTWVLKIRDQWKFRCTLLGNRCHDAHWSYGNSLIIQMLAESFQRACSGQPDGSLTFAGVTSGNVDVVTSRTWLSKVREFEQRAWRVATHLMLRNTWPPAGAARFKYIRVQCTYSSSDQSVMVRRFIGKCVFICT